MPEAKLLRKTFGVLVVNLTARWRLRTVHTRQKLELWSALASGISWTFLANSTFVLFLICLIVKSWQCTILGGNDSAIEVEAQLDPNYSRLRRYNVTMTCEAESDDYFEFHAPTVDLFLRV